MFALKKEFSKPVTKYMTVYLLHCPTRVILIRLISFASFPSFVLNGIYHYHSMAKACFGRDLLRDDLLLFGLDIVGWLQVMDWSFACFRRDGRLD